MQDILNDIHQYNHQLTISQVVTLFERKGFIITKSMIQNYVRDGLLPPPLNKRHYTHKHLTVLALVTQLKTVYELADIKSALSPLMDSEGISLEMYKEFIQKSNKLEFKETIDTLTLMAHSVDLKFEALKRLSG